MTDFQDLKAKADKAAAALTGHRETIAKARTTIDALRAEHVAASADAIASGKPAPAIPAKLAQAQAEHDNAAAILPELEKRAAAAAADYQSACRTDVEAQARAWARDKRERETQAMALIQAALAVWLQETGRTEYPSNLCHVPECQRRSAIEPHVNESTQRWAEIHEKASRLGMHLTQEGLHEATPFPTETQRALAVAHLSSFLE